jgi:hypothetical protein
MAAACPRALTSVCTRMTTPADLAAAAKAGELEAAGRHDEVVLNARERAGKLHAHGHGAAYSKAEREQDILDRSVSTVPKQAA